MKVTLPTRGQHTKHTLINVHVTFSLTICLDIDILEEFAYIGSQEGGGVNLDLLGTSTKAIAQ